MMLFLVIGIASGLLCGLVGAVSGRLIGTILSVTPVFGWSVVLASLARDGLTDPEYRALGLALLGVLVGFFASQLVRRRRRGAHR